ncbi:MAG: peptidase M15, partial [Deltaproteobacteria bacterium HGW-Deltaproteobacteria-20]
MSPGQIRAPLRAKVGKRVANNLYVHTSALPSLPASIRKLVEKAVRVACVDHDSFNVVRVEGGGKSVSLLLYPRFFDDAFPSLAASYRIDIDTEKVSKKRYNGDTNPPILHRKETLLAPDDVRRGSYEELTKAAEGMGLFEDPTTIGTKLGWEARLERLRLRVEGHRLVEIDGDGNGTEDDVVIQRHRTALQRYSLSTPMQALWRHGFLQPASTVFDYGCGRGDDIKILQEQGIAADGWDPHFRPKSARVHADVVNLGFVINVIEAPQER